jgi:hypothetical protein
VRIGSYCINLGKGRPRHRVTRSRFPFIFLAVRRPITDCAHLVFDLLLFSLKLVISSSSSDGSTRTWRSLASAAAGRRLPRPAPSRARRIGLHSIHVSVRVSGRSTYSLAKQSGTTRKISVRRGNCSASTCFFFFVFVSLRDRLRHAP